MKKTASYLSFILCLIYTSCCGQSVTNKAKVTKQRGVLIYYMNEPYFFPTTDTSFEMIAKSNVVGLKLGKIDLNDILDSVSHKSNIVIYAAGDNYKIDTLTSKAGVLLVKMKTKPTKTKLSSDTSAIAFVTGSNEWVFRYEIRFDLEVLSIAPLLTPDIKALKIRLRKLKINSL